MLRRYIRLIYERSLFRFLVVGSLGTVLNLLIFFFVADVIQFNANFAAVLAFCVAVTQNYILNHRWSFKRHVTSSMTLRRYAGFVAVNTIGLLVNLLVLNAILFFFDVPWKIIAQFFGIGAGTLFNYLGSKFFVFKNYDFFN